MNKLLEKEDYTLHDLTNEFNKDGKVTPFQNAGVVIDGEYFTQKLESRYSGDCTYLGDILLSPSKVPTEYMISANDLLREKGWIYQKGQKKNPRKGRDGFTYQYSEGPVTFLTQRQNRAEQSSRVLRWIRRQSIQACCNFQTNKETETII